MPRSSKGVSLAARHDGDAYNLERREEIGALGGGFVWGAENLYVNANGEGKGALKPSQAQISWAACSPRALPSYQY